MFITFEQVVFAVGASLFTALIWLLKAKIAAWDRHIMECDVIRLEDAKRFSAITTKMDSLTASLDKLVSTLMPLTVIAPHRRHDDDEHHGELRDSNL